MDRLTDTVKHSLETFNRCQLCGYESTDICAFRFWYECDEEDKVEPYNVLVICRHNKECTQTITDHPRLYREVPWSAGNPGHFSLLCGECPSRDGTHCTHPNLKANGGEGLDLTIANNPINRAIVCYHNDDSEDGGLHCVKRTPPYIGCAGLPEDHPYHFKIEEDPK